MSAALPTDSASLLAQIESLRDRLAGTAEDMRAHGVRLTEQQIAIYDLNHRIDTARWALDAIKTLQGEATAAGCKKCGRPSEECQCWCSACGKRWRSCDCSNEHLDAIGDADPRPGEIHSNIGRGSRLLAEIDEAEHT